MEKIEEKLAGKVRTVELRVGRDTERDWFPRELMPYLCYWLGAMEGRFVPGESLSLDWHGDVDEARDALQRTRAPGALVYFFSSTDEDRADAKALQNEILHDVVVRTPAKALVAVKLERSANEALFASLGLEKTPAIAVLDAELKPVQTFKGTVKAKALAKVLKNVAKKRRK